MELQKLLEERKAIVVPKKLQDVGTEHETQLTDAVRKNNIDEVKNLLLNHLDKIDMNKGVKGLSPLLTAAVMNRVEICRLLLEIGHANPNDISSRWKTTPLRLAVQAGHIKVVQLLLDAGADVAITEIALEANPLLHLAVRSVRSHSANIVKLLLEKKCDPNGQRSGNLDTPSHVAAKHGNLDVLQVLLDHGAKLDVRNKYGVTPFYDAILKNNLCAAEWLIDKGCNIHDVDMYGVSPIRLAAIERNLAAIKLLIGAGANLREEGPIESGSEGIVDMLADEESFKCLTALLVEGAKQRVFLHSLNLLQQIIVQEQPVSIISYFLKAHPQHVINPEYTRAFFLGHGHLLLLGYMSGMTTLPSISSHTKGSVDCKQQLLELTTGPWRLKSICRVTIRRHLGFSCPYALTALPLPLAIQKYLQLDDLDWCLSCDQCEENEFLIDFSND